MCFPRHPRDPDKGPKIDTQTDPGLICFLLPREDYFIMILSWWNFSRGQHKLETPASSLTTDSLLNPEYLKFYSRKKYLGWREKSETIFYLSNWNILSSMVDENNDKLCKYPTLNERNHSLSVGLVNPFQWVQRGKWKKRITSQWWNLTNTVSTRWSRSTPTAILHLDNMCPWYSVMKMALYFWDLPSQTYSSYLIRRKTSGKFQ